MNLKWTGLLHKIEQKNKNKLNKTITTTTAKINIDEVN